jgi:hypothetical protein
MTTLRLLPCLPAVAIFFASPIHANACDYKPSRMVGEVASAATSAASSAVEASGLSLKSLGYYALAHSSSDLSILGSIASGTSNTGGIIAGTTGVGSAVAGIVMSPFALFSGAVVAVGATGYEAVCYFRIERVTDRELIYGIIADIAYHDPRVTMAETDDGAIMLLQGDDREKSYLVKNLYIADNELIHRDWFLNTNLGPVFFVLPQDTQTN